MLKSVVWSILLDNYSVEFWCVHLFHASSDVVGNSHPCAVEFFYYICCSLQIVWHLWVWHMLTCPPLWGFNWLSYVCSSSIQCQNPRIPNVYFLKLPSNTWNIGILLLTSPHAAVNAMPCRIEYASCSSFSMFFLWIFGALWCDFGGIAQISCFFA